MIRLDPLKKTKSFPILVLRSSSTLPVIHVRSSLVSMWERIFQHITCGLLHINILIGFLQLEMDSEKNFRGQ
jgi:hypothetical protein